MQTFVCCDCGEELDRRTHYCPTPVFDRGEKAWRSDPDETCAKCCHERTVKSYRELDELAPARPRRGLRYKRG